MGRIKTEKPDLIFTADWHIRPDTPMCRKDDFIETMKGKIIFVFDLAQKYNCPIVIAGDLGHRPGDKNWPNWLLEWFINEVKCRNLTIYAIPGQHDLPNHSIKRIGESGFGVLWVADILCFITSISYPISFEDIYSLFMYPFGTKLEEPKGFNDLGQFRIAITHQMIIDKPLWPGQEAPQWKSVLRKHKHFDVIVSGDNHQPFVGKLGTRILVNPGSLMRTTAIQTDHLPRVYLWYSKTNSVKPVFIPIQPASEVIDLDYLENQKEREQREIEFISKLKEDDEDSDLDFEATCVRGMKENKLNKRTKEMIIESLEESK
jgi:hypothetical protein